MSEHVQMSAQIYTMYSYEKQSKSIHFIRVKHVCFELQLMHAALWVLLVQSKSCVTYFKDSLKTKKKKTRDIAAFEWFIPDPLIRSFTFWT